MEALVLLVGTVCILALVFLTFADVRSMGMTRREAVLYVMGMVVVFVVLALLLILAKLRESGFSFAAL